MCALFSQHNLDASDGDSSMDMMENDPNTINPQQKQEYRGETDLLYN